VKVPSRQTEARRSRQARFCDFFGLAEDNDMRLRSPIAPSAKRQFGRQLGAIVAYNPVHRRPRCASNPAKLLFPSQLLAPEEGLQLASPHSRAKEVVADGQAAGLNWCSSGHCSCSPRTRAQKAGLATPQVWRGDPREGHRTKPSSDEGKSAVRTTLAAVKGKDPS